MGLKDVVSQFGRHMQKPFPLLVILLDGNP